MKNSWKGSKRKKRMEMERTRSRIASKTMMTMGKPYVN